MLHCSDTIGASLAQQKVVSAKLGSTTGTLVFYVQCSQGLKSDGTQRDPVPAPPFRAGLFCHGLTRWSANHRFGG